MRRKKGEGTPGPMAPLRSRIGPRTQLVTVSIPNLKKMMIQLPPRQTWQSVKKFLIPYSNMLNYEDVQMEWEL